MAGADGGWTTPLASSPILVTFGSSMSQLSGPEGHPPCSQMIHTSFKAPESSPWIRKGSIGGAHLSARDLCGAGAGADAAAPAASLDQLNAWPFSGFLMNEGQSSGLMITRPEESVRT